MGLFSWYKWVSFRDIDRSFFVVQMSLFSSEWRFNITKRDSSVPRKETYLYHEKRPIYIMKRDPFISRTALKLVIGMDGEIRKLNSQNSGFFSNLLVDKTLSSIIRDNEDDALAIHLYHAKRPICITKRDPFISRKETHLYHGRNKSWFATRDHRDIRDMGAWWECDR